MDSTIQERAKALADAIKLWWPTETYKLCLVDLQAERDDMREKAAKRVQAMIWPYSKEQIAQEIRELN